MEIEWSIIKRIIENRASAQQRSEFEAWINESEQNRHCFEEMKEYYDDPIKAESLNAQSERRGIDGMNLIHFSRRRRVKRILLSATSSAAVLAILFFLMFPLQSNFENQEPTKKAFVKAELTLPEGVILLKGNHDTLTNIEDVTFNEDLISYANVSEKNIEQEYHIIKTPVGKSFSVVLSDGTKVHLNAMSELRYPTSFVGEKSRRVYLKGEAYFEVSKSSTAFEVKSSGVNVRVYGTKFDINSYDSTNIRTVLLSGSVGVSIDNRDDVIERMLTPNQLASIDLKTTNCEISEVNALDYLSWTDGVIKSYNASLDDLIFKLGHWYGVKFTLLDKTLGHLPITASFNNSQKIEEIVSAVESILQIKIEKIEGGYFIQK